MNCPFCRYTKFKVTNKRESSEGIRRRRECLKCGNRFTTYERVAGEDIYIIKKNNVREKFDADKLKRGLNRAFEKRPISQEKIDKVIIDIEEQIRKRGKREIKTKTIGEMMMKRIRKLDKVAYIRFASVYRDFNDIEDFKVQLEALE